ncbi:nuclear transcription factor Y subunit B-1-like [Panicum miliaceum]|uniref:Nuclear transcription factor Y subunit B-1-like n=1 Tax=Panicum miliaceum TaxID=4540 RepID=A0A3L6PDD1_PANMI|nr:nuclear transcription factor Y subunit B-1-like [Panicum miliaceum]
MDLCVAEFAKVLARAAMQECRRDRRLTITGDDLIIGMRSLGFYNYAGPLNRHLSCYRESEGTMPQGRHSARCHHRQCRPPWPPRRWRWRRRRRRRHRLVKPCSRVKSW